MSKTLNFPLPRELRERLEAESERTGAPLAEITRRALDAYLSTPEVTYRGSIRERRRRLGAGETS